MKVFKIKLSDTNWYYIVVSDTWRLYGEMSRQQTLGNVNKLRRHMIHRAPQRVDQQAANVAGV